MLFTKSVVGVMPVLVMLKPRYSTSSQANWNFFLLKIIPPFPQMSRKEQVAKKLSLISLPQMILSSTHLRWLGKFPMISSDL